MAQSTHLLGAFFCYNKKYLYICNMKKLLRKLFNGNTGYFTSTYKYHYQGEFKTGYVLYQKFVFFGIPGFTKVDSFADKEKLDTGLNKLNITLNK